MPGKTPTIGVFDSGFGGLTVLKALLELIPEANYLYFGDTARLPYGSKSAETVAKYAIEASRFLEERGANLLVTACNTATALANEAIRKAVSVPVIGVIEPGAERALLASRAQKVTVIATEATVSSHAYQKALQKRGLQATEKACPLLVPLVEEGWLDHPVTEQVAQIYLSSAFTGKFEAADVLLLGCTHYPLLKPIFRRVAPAHVTIVDSAESTAQVVSQQLALGSPSAAQPAHTNSIQFFATDSVEKFQTLGERFLGRPIHEVMHVDLRE